MTRLAAFLSMLFAAGTALAGEALDVTDAYVRAVPPGVANSAGFMTLSNGGGEPRFLTGAESPASEVVELHSHTMEGGMMRMRRIERIEVPAGGSVTLEPGGLHLMLIGLKGPLAPGEEVALTLTFDDGGRAVVSAPVRPVMPEAGREHHHH
jgi:periplasmic copper chaperone A